MARIQNHPTSLLLLEGNDDFHVIHSLCKQSGVPIRNLENPTGGNFSCIDCKGIDGLLEQIEVRFKSSPLITTIGVIVDADINLKNRWESLKVIISNLAFTPPENIPPTGLILNHQNLRMGVWIMPNNNLNGMLEDFISFLVPKDDKLLPIVYSTLLNIEQENLNKYSLIHKAKAVIHSWLSWQGDPGTPMGLAITKRYLTTDNESCKLLINWLNELFNR